MIQSNLPWGMARFKRPPIKINTKINGKEGHGEHGIRKPEGRSKQGRNRDDGYYQNCRWFEIHWSPLNNRKAPVVTMYK